MHTMRCEDNGSVDCKPPLLIFRLYGITKDANWDCRDVASLPAGCAAIAISGGTCDMIGRRRGKRSSGANGLSVIEPPFLSSAPSWLLPRCVWALLGSQGRFYPIYRTAASTLIGRGYADPVLQTTRRDVLASLKLTSLAEAERLPWSNDFLTPFSRGIGLGFWGDRARLERRLRRADTFSPYRDVAESRHESTKSRLADSQPHLYANWDLGGFEWILENAQLVVRPWGWEGEDAILMSNRMDHEHMVSSIRHQLSADMRIIEYDGDETYRSWAKWRPDGGSESDEFLDRLAELV